MRKLVIGCVAGILLSIIGLAIGAEWFMSWSSTTLAVHRECQAYVDQTLVDITGQWDPNAFIWHLDPETFEPGDEDEIESLFRHYRRLGPLVVYHASEGRVTESEAGALEFSYRAEADYQKGRATLRVQGIRLNDDWYLRAIDVQSPALAD